ncbi:ABC transporter permease [Proteiniclasticum ruminis]|uniref:Osmoprotectant transport system permease protein n=1 Tax=Proteiniclasticum ruminis TaxID=398199 RepID=A0A1G8LWE2_9CLOT|nr:ABC transporter permease [Proteiniclasticum ruminis]SDI59978.1 osmoprotectant transport system permease protein [Proteiniclasticum ruminis]
MKNSRLYAALLLSVLLALLLIFPKEFEGFLGRYFLSKFPEGSRTPLSQLFTEHMEMVVISSALAISSGIFLGIFLTTKVGAPFKDSLLKLVSLGQTFPSAALLALVVPVVGYGLKGALIALYLYALMPIVYNVVVGIEEVPESVVEAAKGMGMSEVEIYRKVKIPLAMNAILGGIRTSTVINISAATLAAAAGAGGLGVLVVNGVRTFDMILILMGSIPVTLLAVIVELSLEELQKRTIYIQ